MAYQVSNEQEVIQLLAKIKQSRLCECKWQGEFRYFRAYVFNPDKQGTRDEYGRYEFGSDLIKSSVYQQRIKALYAQNAIKTLPLKLNAAGTQRETEDEHNPNLSVVQNLKSWNTVEPVLNKVLSAMEAAIADAQGK